MKRYIWRYGPAIVWMAVIFWLSSKTGEEVDSVLPLFQKFMPWISDFNWGHFISYFILAFTYDLALGKRAGKWRWKVAIVLLCGLYGVSDEWHQSFVGGRMMDIIDVRNDMIGAAIWVLVAKIPFVKKKLYH